MDTARRVLTEIAPGKKFRVLAMDTEVGLQRAVIQAHTEAGATQSQMENQILVGTDGNILEHVSDTYPAFTSIIAGPPCPPFSSAGRGDAWSDQRALPFICIVNQICHQANMDDTKLVNFIIENVSGIGQRDQEGNSALKEVMTMLKDELGTSCDPQMPFRFSIGAKTEHRSRTADRSTGAKEANEQPLIKSVTLSKVAALRGVHGQREGRPSSTSCKDPHSEPAPN